MKFIKIYCTLLFTIAPYAQADFKEIPIKDIDLGKGRELCSPQYDERLGYIVNKHLQAINEAVSCNQVSKAREIAMSLTELLGRQGGGTAQGICYDDRRCTSRLSSSYVTKADCSAAGGKGWIQMTPTQGNCELVR